METESRTRGDPITVPLQQVHMLLAGRIPLLQFCRQFGWADLDDEMINPFMDRSRDGYRLASVEVSDRDLTLPLITFHFEQPTEE